MTITGDLKLVSKVKVGTSTEYAVTTVSTSSRVIGAANQTRESYEEIRWDLECLADASSPIDITAFNETLRSELVKIGQAVTLTELGTSRILPAQGIGGSLTGYPRVEISDIPDKSYGQYQAFNLTAITQVPIVDLDGIVEHTTETETVTNTDGTIETSVRGEIRLGDGVDASAWVNTNILAPTRAAADIAGNAVQSRVTVTDDVSHAKYSYSVKPSATGTPGVTDASVEDRTVKDVTGRRIRTISGFATGPNATVYATTQRVAEAANLKLLREDGPSLPSIPDGRVNFNYQYVAGVVSGAFPGIFITRFKETIRQVGGGNQINTSSFFTQDPALRLGIKLPVQYTQTSEIEFIGSFPSHGLSPLLAEDNISGLPRERRSGDGSLKTVSIEWNYIFDAPIDPFPTPTIINGLT